MQYETFPRYHYKPRRGWINDPNGCVCFGGYYHVFYQHQPHYELTKDEPMHWGHARTKDFLHWEELPIALYPDQPYDANGCWSGTATVKDGKLYLFYASIQNPPAPGRNQQAVSVACSSDGIHFKKYAGNPVIATYPEEGGPDFRDPAVVKCGEKYYLVVASGNAQAKAARLLVYESDTLLHWTYNGVLAQWDNALFAECPSLVPCGEKYMLSASVCREEGHFFTVMYGDFDGHTFRAQAQGNVDRGPDQYAGQMFTDEQGRQILLSWIPGWRFRGFLPKDIGCLSLPKQLLLREGRLRAYPVQEVRHLLREADPLVQRTPEGFCIQRTLREPVVYRGEIRDIKILRDEYILEVFVNGGEEVVTAVLC